ncbi:MAG TPA: YqgE/AlgH family protein [Vicinamibacterales bacterium]
MRRRKETLVHRRYGNAVRMSAACIALLLLLTGAPRDLGAQLLPGAVRALAPGRLLVAARHLADPNFSDTVVFLVDYSDEGAMGLIINRRTDVPLVRAFPLVSPAPDPQQRLYFGGPVAPTGVMALLRSNSPRSDAREVIGGVYLITEREPLESQLRARTGPDRFRVYVGYSGWGPGQLDRETAEGSWHVLPATADVIFDAAPESLWERQIRLTRVRVARLDAPVGRTSAAW